MPTSFPREFEHAPFSVHEALERGVDASRLRRRDLRADFHGVRVPAHLEPGFVTACRAYATRLRPGQFFSHVTAARLWGMRLSSRWEVGPLHVTTVLPARTPRTRGVVGHHCEHPGPDLAVVDGLVLSTPAETWRALSSLLSLDELVVAGDGLVSRTDPLATMRMLRRAVALNAGRRGNRRLRAALDLVRPGSDSPRETRLRLCLIRAGLPEPEVNGLLTEHGEPERFGDLVYRAERVVVEYEGAHHQRSRLAYLGDIERFETLAARWTFVRVTREHSDAEVVARVRRALASSRDAGFDSPAPRSA